MPRSSLTILLITRDLLVRADFKTGAEVRPVGVWQEPRPAVEDLPSLVEAALRLGPKRAGRVWVLSTEVWTQTMDLPAETVAGLGDEELNRSLGFEAEPLSGIGAFDARTTHVELPGEAGARRFWIAQVLTAHLEQIEYLAEQAGGRLAGVAHPGGLPEPISQAGARTGAWHRVELWPDAIVCLSGQTGHPVAVRVINSDPKAGRWRTELEGHRPRQPSGAVREILCGTGSVAASELDANHVTTVDDQVGVEQWLRAWAERLSGRVPGVPLIRAPKRPLSAARRRGLAVVLGLVALAICIGQSMFIQSQRKDLQARIEALAEPKKQFDALVKQAGELEEQRTGLDQEVLTLRGDLERCDQVLRAQQRRFARLLAALAEQGDDGILVQRIDCSGDEVAIRGICLRPELANRLASGIDESVAPLGWQAEPSTKEAQLLLGDGGPWKFEIQLRETPNWRPPKPQQPAATAGQPQPGEDA